MRGVGWMKGERWKRDGCDVRKEQSQPCTRLRREQRSAAHHLQDDEDEDGQSETAAEKPDEKCGAGGGKLNHVVCNFNHFELLDGNKGLRRRMDMQQPCRGQ